MNLTYPETPGCKERGATSEEAARHVKSRVEELQALVMFNLCHRELSADALAGCLKESVLSIRPRLSELRRKGLIEPTGRRAVNASGRSAHVWRVK